MTLEKLFEGMTKALTLMDEAKKRAKLVAKDQRAMDQLVEEYLDELDNYEEHVDGCEDAHNPREPLCTVGNLRVLSYTVALAAQDYMVAVREGRDEGLAVPRLMKIPRHLRVQTAIVALSTTPYTT